MTYGCAVVTGAANGIGRALAVRLSEAGARLVLADVRAEPLAAVAAELKATAIPTDVSDLGAVQALADAAPEADLICLNAGIVGSLGAPWELSAADWDAVFAVNVGGVLNGLRAFVPTLLASGRQANILITASLAGLAGFGGIGAYGPSKHTVVAVAEQAALALAGTAITVTVLCPSLVKTGMSEIGDDPLDVADAALAAIARGQFVLTPPEWHGAIVRRAERFVDGRQPASAEPSQPPRPD
jgi:NAD(P)-dependent dehydrogenase (short-subunit alcohol dehydrogenase family)